MNIFDRVNMRLGLIGYQYLDFLTGKNFIEFILLCDSYLNRLSDYQFVITMRSIYLSPKAEEGVLLFYPHNGLHFGVTILMTLVYYYIIIYYIDIFSY